MAVHSLSKLFLLDQLLRATSSPLMNLISGVQITDFKTSYI